jgi:hypothetical protein
MPLRVHGRDFIDLAAREFHRVYEIRFRAVLISSTRSYGQRICPLLDVSSVDDGTERPCCVLLPNSREYSFRLFFWTQRCLLARRSQKVVKPSGPVVAPWLNARRDLIAACHRICIRPVTPNDLRRTFASWLKQRGRGFDGRCPVDGQLSSDRRASLCVPERSEPYPSDEGSPQAGGI